MSRDSLSRLAGLLGLLAVLTAWSGAQAQTYVTGWDNQGVPDNLVTDVPVSSGILSSINSVLSEYRDVRTYHPEFIASDEQVRLRITQDANVQVTFVHEGAGYRNSVGCFTYPEGSPPASVGDIDHEILFPNASYTGSGGDLHTGATVTLGLIPGGTNIGFWVRANAWQPATATVSTSGLEFSTISGLNLEPTAELRAHTVLLWEESGQQLVLGFEDLLRTQPGCDHDFNDVVFLVTVDPPEAIALDAIRPLPGAQDSDGDGVLDVQDAFPEDAQRAFVQFTPSVNGREMAAYEDQWPFRGDYDFNDLVVRYRFREVLDAQGRIKETTALIEPVARGAAQHNGLALCLPAAGSEVELLEVTHDDVPVPAAAVLESDGTSTIVQIIGDAHHMLPTPAGASFANTEPGTEEVAGTLVQVRVIFTQPMDRSQLGLPPYDLFLFRTADPGIEVHMLDRPPTFRATLDLIGTGDDTGDPVTGTYYRDNLGFPWAMILPSDWRHPQERVELPTAYTLFPSWVETSGSSAGTWATEADLRWVW